MPAKKKSVYRQIRHPFLFHVVNGSGKKKVVKVFARVREAKHPVTIVLEEKHVAKSIRLRGRGNTVHCSMAVCTYDHASAFPHPVEGHVDWTYNRAFVVSKNNAMGLPAECWCYEHNSTIARNQDLPGGQQKLLDKIRRLGPVRVELKPYRKRSTLGRPGASRKISGARNPLRRKGANLRYAVASLSGIPA